MAIEYLKRGKPEAERSEDDAKVRSIVEGTLKDGLRHLYAKRRYLIDEDSWMMLDGMRWDGIYDTMACDGMDIRHDDMRWDGIYDTMACNGMGYTTR